MRLSSEFLRQVRTLLKSGSEAERILDEIIEFRELNDLDEKFPPDDTASCVEDQLEYEVNKLAIVFEGIRIQGSLEDQELMVETLKETYPEEEVDEILEEYFPELQKPKCRS